MYEIKVLTIKLLKLGKYLDSNQELTVPQTATLPIELYLPSGRVIRTLTYEHQKSMIYLLIHSRLIQITRLELASN